MKVQNGWVNVLPASYRILSLKKLSRKTTDWENRDGKKTPIKKKLKQFQFMNSSVVKKKELLPRI